MSLLETERSIQQASVPHDNTIVGNSINYTHVRPGALLETKFSILQDVHEKPTGSSIEDVDVHTNIPPEDSATGMEGSGALNHIRPGLNRNRKLLDRKLFGPEWIEPPNPLYSASNPSLVQTKSGEALTGKRRWAPNREEVAINQGHNEEEGSSPKRQRREVPGSEQAKSPSKIMEQAKEVKATENHPGTQTDAPGVDQDVMDSIEERGIICKGMKTKESDLNTQTGSLDGEFDKFMIEDINFSTGRDIVFKGNAD
jgi:hypothetical protein